MTEAKLPFKCPNKVPKDVPQPGTDTSDLDGKVGILPKINVSAIETTSVYNQFQAASALVPCDQEPLSIFIPGTLVSNGSNPHGRFSVAVIYTDKPSIQNIKHWLKWVDQTQYQLFYLV